MQVSQLSRNIEFMNGIAERGAVLNRKKPSATERKRRPV